MRFGLHLPTGGRLADAPERAAICGCQSLQIFCGNPRGWSKPPLDRERVAEFKAAAVRAQLEPVIVHATYLINLAAPDDSIYRLSVSAFLDELRRSADLGARFYVVHSGSHKGTGEEGGRARIREALRRALDEVPAAPEILLENTAGTANSLGTTLQDLAALLEGAPTARASLCFDTCHALAAGYEIRTPEGVGKLLDEFDRVLSLSRLRCLHVNDSKGGLDSHLDRHEHIGEGAVGASGFQAFFSDRRLWDLPAILETPLDGPDDDRRNLRRAVELAVAAGAVSPEVLENIPAEPVGRRAKKCPVIVKPPALAKPPALVNPVRKARALRKPATTLRSARKRRKR
jgi:deoxyribonuclease-4